MKNFRILSKSMVNRMAKNSGKYFKQSDLSDISIRDAISCSLEEIQKKNKRINK